MRPSTSSLSFTVSSQRETPCPPFANKCNSTGTLSSTNLAAKEVKSEGRITDSKEYIEHYPPDTTAAIFWLKNRQPEKWRDKKEVDANVNLGDELEGLSDEQLQAIIDGKEEE